MRTSSGEVGLPKDPEFWYEVEFNVPNRGRRPSNYVMDVLADTAEDAEQLAMGCGPAGGVLTQVYKRGTAREYEVALNES